MIHSNIIKIILVFLLLLCLLKLPYGLYMLMRVAFTFCFIVLAIRANEAKNQAEVFIYVALAIIFQPFLKIALGRTIWNIVDVVVSVALAVDVLRSFIKAKKQGNNFIN